MTVDVNLIITSILSFSAMLISLFALLTSLKNRRNALREKVFDLQLVAFQELCVVMDKMESYFGWFNTFLQDGDLERYRSAHDGMYNVLEEFDQVQAKYEIVIPDDIYILLTNFSKLVKRKWIEASNLNTTYEEKKYSDLSYQVVEAFREFLGVEKLSKENFKLAQSIRGSLKPITNKN